MKTIKIMNPPRVVYTLAQSYTQIKNLSYAETRERVISGGVHVEASR